MGKGVRPMPDETATAFHRLTGSDTPPELAPAVAAIAATAAMAATPTRPN